MWSVGEGMGKVVGRWAEWIALVVSALALAGCGTYFLPRQQKASVLASEAGWQYRLIDSGPFTMAAAFGPATQGVHTLVVYLEGDGLAFLGNGAISPDPTPTDPYALRLALAHPGGRAAYLARPCQYGMTRECSPRYWTSHRYAPAVIQSVGDALSQLERLTGASRLILVGYSGGGGLAALIAADRADVSALVTVAADLDLGEWTRREGLTPLWGSEDPASRAPSLAALPQVHFVGGRDTVVPPYVARSFLAKMGGGAAARMIEQPGYGHDCCWAENWSHLARQPGLTELPGWSGS